MGLRKDERGVVSAYSTFLQWDIFIWGGYAVVLSEACESSHLYPSIDILQSNSSERHLAKEVPYDPNLSL